MSKAKSTVEAELDELLNMVSSTDDTCEDNKVEAEGESAADGSANSAGLDWVSAVSGAAEPALDPSLVEPHAFAGQADEKKVRTSGEAIPFKLGSESAATVSALPALDRMNERLARRIRSTVEPIARTKLKVTPKAVKTQTFKEWQELQPDFCSLTVMTFVPLNGVVAVMVEPRLINRLVDTYYGGAGNDAPVHLKEFTPTEERMIDKLNQAWGQALAEVWSEIVPAEFRLRTRESNVGFANFARSDETVAVAEFSIEFNSGASAKIELIYPVTTLRHVERDLATANKDEHGARNYEWRRKLNSAVRDVRMQARTVLARPELTMSELVQLRPGDIIPLNLSVLVPLIVQDHEIAVGTIGEHNGRAALKIETLNSKDDLQ